MKTYNLTVKIEEYRWGTLPDILNKLSELPYAVAPRYNEELNELTVLCEVTHAADIERILAPYV